MHTVCVAGPWLCKLWTLSVSVRFTHPNFPNPTFCSPVSFRCAQWFWHFNIPTHIQTPSCAVLSLTLPLDTSKLSSVHNPCPQTGWRGRVLCPDLFVELHWFNGTMVKRSQKRCGASKIGSDGRGHAQSLRPHRNRSKAEGPTALTRPTAVSRKNLCEDGETRSMAS